MLKLKTIEELRDRKIVELKECSVEEKEAGIDVVRDKAENKHYKVIQTNEEITIEILNECSKSLNTIKYIMIAFAIVSCFSILLGIIALL